MIDIKPFIAKVSEGASLTQDEAHAAFDILMSGTATSAQIAALLIAMRVRGETVDEITGAVTAMRDKMLRVVAPEDAIDVVGTGGDGKGSYNVSTATAFVWRFPVAYKLQFQQEYRAYQPPVKPVPATL